LVRLHRSFRDGSVGREAERVLRGQAIASSEAVEEVGPSFLSTIAEVTAPFTPKFPSIVPAQNLNTLVTSGFDIAQQLPSTGRKLMEAAVAIVTRQAA
jgi:hypothetical protein